MRNDEIVAAGAVVPMKLRGHHLFCTALFSGHGYDRAFTQRMEQVVAAMEEGKRFVLTAGHDDLCQACPNRTEQNGCALGTENVRARDAAALAVLGFHTGQELCRDAVRPLLAALSEEQFQQVCGDCRWQKEGLCSLKLLKKDLL